MPCPTVRDICRLLDSLAPLATQCAWDNSGLLVGDPDRPVRTAALALDITPAAVEAAHDAGAELLVSHHPVIFHPLKRMDPRDPAYLLARYDIAALCLHTPLDKASGGVNDALAAALGFENAVPFAAEGDAAMLRTADVAPVDAPALAARVANALHTTVRLADAGRTIRRVALVGGAGADFLPEAAGAGIDALITGDAGHHDFLDAKQLGVTLIAAGHYETEQPVIAALARKLEAAFDLRVICLPQTSPVTFLSE
ncbi:MAG: Nif3-like dinuclear metal center hexameric protein [Clostridia bacterium]|nr:Nif3-like dinuclear metal center hexameric protein [Clostridia bacterium]